MSKRRVTLSLLTLVALVGIFYLLAFRYNYSVEGDASTSCEFVFIGVVKYYLYFAAFLQKTF